LYVKALAVIGSRNQEGRTALAAKALVDGMSAFGAEVETIFLPEMMIERCRQCNADGWGTCRSEGRCIIGDDFDEIERKLDAADAAVFANPVYYGDLSESMRAFTDRLRRCNWMVMRETGKTKFFKPILGINMAGGGGAGTEISSASLKGVLTTCGFEVIDMINVRRQNFEVKLKTLRIVGEWFPEYVTSGEWERVIPQPK
jgi:multimeric flavodoxin WrbA